MAQLSLRLGLVGNNETQRAQIPEMVVSVESQCIYFLQVKTDDGVVNKKIIVNK